MAGNDKDKKKKPQTPGGGKSKKSAAPAKGPAAPAPATGGQTSIYANDPESGGMQPLVPGPGYTDHRPKNYKGGSAQTFVNGHGLDMGRTENRNFVSEVNRHERDMFRRRANAEKEEFDRKSRQDRDKRISELLARANQERRDRNFERGVFSTREGWENLGRTKGRDKDGNEVLYGRGAAGVKDYDARYEKLRKRADQLTKWLEEGDFAGRGKEWAEIRKTVARTHAGGGLTEKQLEGIEAKMDSILSERNERADRANRLQAFYANKTLQEQRQKLGDSYGLLTDEQVKSMSDKQKWDNIRKASDAYLASVNQKDESGKRIDPDTVVKGFDKNGDFGTISRGGDRVKAMQDMLDNGISLTTMARMAVQSGDKKWQDSYQKIMASQDAGKRDRAVESLGHAYLRSMLDKGDEGIKSLSDAIAKANTVSGKPSNQGPNKILSWDDEESPAPVTKPDGTNTPVLRPFTPQDARTSAENAEILRQGATAEEAAQPGPTAKRADESVQKAGTIAEAAANAGTLPPALTPREKSAMKEVPGSHQSDGSMGEVTPTRAAGLPDIVANTKESLAEEPLTPRKEGTPAPVQEEKDDGATPRKPKLSPIVVR